MCTCETGLCKHQSQSSLHFTFTRGCRSYSTQQSVSATVPYCQAAAALRNGGKPLTSNATAALAHSTAGVTSTAVSRSVARTVRTHGCTCSPALHTPKTTRRRGANPCNFRRLHWPMPRDAAIYVATQSRPPPPHPDTRHQASASPAQLPPKARATEQATRPSVPAPRSSPVRARRRQVHPRASIQ